MSERERVVREVLREVLGELLPSLAEPPAAAPPPARAVDGPAVPQVPAPPVAAVHRPSGWAAPEPAPRAEPAPAPAPEDAPPQAGVEEVAIRSDEDLNAFALRLLRLYENPRDRQALRTGRLRFALRGGAAGPASAAPAHRVERGAVTERVVDEAAAAGARLVLGPAAVLTPMARDRARALQVEIEREKRC